MSWPSCASRASVGTAKSGVPMKTTRMAGSGRVALGRLGELLDHPVALQLRQVVDEQHAVELVDLVLDAGREQSAGLDLLLLAVEVAELHAHPVRPLDLGVVVLDRQAALVVDP